VNRVTADSNIYISAFLRGGRPLELLEMARAGQSELAVTEDILNEIGRVLGTKFRVPAEDVQAFRVEILSFTKLVTPGESLDAVPADPTDNRILECAVAAGSEVIVSGDKHLLGLGNFRGIEIVSVGEFLQHGPCRAAIE
jgi:putative PIN family toxin of toxin-antitoxin system